MYLPLVARGWPPASTPCSVRRLRVSVPALRQEREVEFGPWPGPFYGNIVLPYGARLNFETTDGEKTSSSLTWFKNGSWYHYYEQRASWSFWGTSSPSGWFELEAGREYDFAAWFTESGQLCNMRITMQWDP